MANKNGLNSSWMQFERQVMRNITNPVQLNETMKAFKSGYVACFVYLTRDVGDMSEIDGPAAIQELEHEVNDFVKEMLVLAAAAVLKEHNKPM